jgi:pyrrolidone-carboxylate peptidase
MVKEMNVLITGFDPFGGAAINPAFEAVKLLPDTQSLKRMAKFWQRRLRNKILISSFASDKRADVQIFLLKKLLSI